MADMKRRSFFGTLAGLLILPLWKPQPLRKYLDVPDGYDWLRIIDCKEPGHVHCYDTGTIDVVQLHEISRRFDYSWFKLFEGNNHFFRVHLRTRQPSYSGGLITLNEWREMENRNDRPCQ